MIDSPELHSSPACARITAGTQPLIVIDRRPVIGRSVCCWISTFGPEFDPLHMASIEHALGQDILGQACAVIWATSAHVPWEDEWLSNEIARTRMQRHDVPLVLLADATDPHRAEEAVRQLHLSGYIPTTSSPELAATALRLVIAGGRYVPGNCYDADTKTKEVMAKPAWVMPGRLTSSATPMAEQDPPMSAYDANLTARERDVLELLECGVAYKIIAHRLGISQSTVKAHIHNLIVKLKVRNRTEAAVARYATRSERASVGTAAAVAAPK